MKKKILTLLAALVLLASPVFGQGQFAGGASNTTKRIYNAPLIANLAVAPPIGTVAIITNGSTASDCSAGGGSFVVFCLYNGTSWVSVANSGGGGGGLGNPLIFPAGQLIYSTDTNNPFLQFGANSLTVGGGSSTGCTFDNLGNLSCPGTIVTNPASGVGCTDWYDSGGIKFFEICSPDVLVSTVSWTWPTTQATGLVAVDGSGQLFYAQPSANVGSGLVSGGGVFCSTSALTCAVAPAVYTIAGVTYNSAQTTVTFDSNSSGSPRIDVIYVDNTGTAAILKGTAAANPAKPTIDPATQLEITFVTIADSASSPSVSDTDIYLEGAGPASEWTASRSPATDPPWNLVSTTNPFAGTKDIEATSAAATNYVKFVIGSGTVTIPNFNVLNMYLRSKAAWPKNKCLSLQWYLSTTPVGSPVAVCNGSFAFNSAVTASYQQITIAASAWAATTPVDTLRITVTGTGSNIGFYLDNIVLQSGQTAPPPVGQPVIYRTCMITVHDDNASSVLADADLGPQKRKCFIDRASTLQQIAVSADAGTPNVLLQKRIGNSTVADVLSGALATASSGNVACAKSLVSQSCIDGTTSSGTIYLTNTSLAAGTYIELKSGTAGGTAKSMQIAVTFTVNQ